MGPPRKSRSVNKRFSYINEVSPSKDGENSKKNIQRKRKLSDMLGPQWSKIELERFYEAYRKYGKDWKKVAAVVRNRSVEMVEALYSMNRAYLSLPEGTASVVGLIAMMTDHYSNLAGSDSEQESNDGAGTSRKPQKRARGKVQPNISKGSDGRVLSHSQTVTSSYGCLPLLKKKRSGGSRPRAVGKRTPRFPVSYSCEKVGGEKLFSPTRQGLKLKEDANDDEVAHEIAIALAEASQRGGSPQVSQTPNRRTEFFMSSHVRNAERMCAETEMTSAKLVGSDIDEDELEGSMEADNGEFSREKSYIRETESVSTVVQKGRRHHEKKLEVDDSCINHLDDIKEACSGTEEGQKLGAVTGKFDMEVTDAKIPRSSVQGSRKRSKKVLFRRDEDELEGSMEADNGEFSREKSYIRETESVSTVVQKGRRHHEKKLEVDDSCINHLDDIKEACSGTEEGQKLGAVTGKFDMEVTDAKIPRSSVQGSRKRSKKVLFRRDEGSDFDALQTLADLSLMMPATADENDEGSDFDALQTLADLSLMMPATADENGQLFPFCLVYRLYDVYTMEVLPMLAEKLTNFVSPTPALVGQ
ncbi:unnamed protein product [Ilex paraguariensis]|uniref:SANT domain-containing protein n=1 Tax=Ilex paraguariensis TaxID=185542 RepID=A0ABC8SR77_9AQUA